MDHHLLPQQRHAWSRSSPLESAFSLAIHSLLTACSKEEFVSHFPSIKSIQLDFLYKFYTQMLATIHENVEDEFRTICQETKVMNAFDDLEQLAKGKERGDGSTRRLLIAVQEEAVIIKSEEINCLRHSLQQVKEQQHALALKLKTMRTDLLSLKGKKSMDSVFLEK